jgi:hypothetical protein
MISPVAPAVAVLQLAAALFLAVRAIGRLNTAFQFPLGDSRFYARLLLGGLYALISMGLVFSLPHVWRSLR